MIESLLEQKEMWDAEGLLEGGEFVNERNENIIHVKCTLFH